MATGVERRSPSLPGSSAVAHDEPVEVGRYLAALRRNRVLILLIVVPITATVLALSLMLPKTYTADARIVMRGTPFELADVETVRRELATTRALLTTRAVYQRAAAQLPDESVATLDGKVTSSVDSQANIIDVTATDSSPAGAAAIANAVASAFLARERSLERDQLAQARSSLEAALRRLRGSPNADVQTAAIRERLSELSVAEASSGTRLQLAEPAEPPTTPSAPRPVRNTVLALFAALFLGVLAAIGREQLVPRISGVRELSRLTGLPVLGGIPSEGRRRPRRTALGAIERDAYEGLVAALKMRLEPSRQEVVLVTSALGDEGKTELTANLGRALAQAGENVLLVAADLRRPRLHEHFEMNQEPGLSDVLAASPRRSGRRGAKNAASAASPAEAPVRGPGQLHVIPSGSKEGKPAQLLSSPALESFFDEIADLDYTFVLVDAPPLLGVVDTQVLARHVENLLVVSRPERLTRENALDLHEVLQRLDVEILGLVVVGDAAAAVTYYAGYGVLGDPD